MYVNFHVPGFLGGTEYVAAVSPDPPVIGVVHVPELSSHLQSITMHIMYVYMYSTYSFLRKILKRGGGANILDSWGATLQIITL